MRYTILFLSEQMEMGGTQRETLLLCRELNRLGHTTLVASNGGVLVRDLHRAGTLHYDIPFHSGRGACFAIGALLFPLSLMRLSKLAKRANLIHTSGNFVAIALGLLIARITKRPSVVTINDGILDRPVKVSILLAMNVLKHFDKIIVISDEMRHLLLRKDISGMKNRFVVVPNMVDLEEYSNDLDPCSIDLNTDFSHNGQRILWVSRQGADKIEAIRNLIWSLPTIVTEIPHAQLIIAGSGPRHEEVSDLAESVNRSLGKRVITVTGFVKETIPLMKYVDVVVGMGKVALEAMACRKAVVVVGQIVGQYGGNFAGILSQTNVEAVQNCNYSGRNSQLVTSPGRIADACIRLLADSGFRLGVADYGRRIVEQTHDSRKVVKRVESVYSKVTHERTGSWKKDKKVLDVSR